MIVSQDCINEISFAMSTYLAARISAWEVLIHEGSIKPDARFVLLAVALTEKRQDFRKEWKQTPLRRPFVVEISRTVGQQPIHRMSE